MRYRFFFFFSVAVHFLLGSKQGFWAAFSIVDNGTQSDLFTERFYGKFFKHLWVSCVFCPLKQKHEKSLVLIHGLCRFLASRSRLIIWDWLRLHETWVTLILSSLWHLFSARVGFPISLCSSPMSHFCSPSLICVSSYTVFYYRILRSWMARFEVCLVWCTASVCSIQET